MLCCKYTEEDSFFLFRFERSTLRLFNCTPSQQLVVKPIFTSTQKISITKIQNHRMAGVGRDLCGSSSPTPCQSRVTYCRLQRTASRWGLNISREGDSTASLGSLGQGSVTLRGKKFFLNVQLELPLLQFVPIAPCPVAGHH